MRYYIMNSLNKSKLNSKIFSKVKKFKVEFILIALSMIATNTNRTYNLIDFL